MPSSAWKKTAELLEALHDIGQRLPELWEQQRLLSSAQKKALLRSLIDKVVVHRLGGRRGYRIHVRAARRSGATAPLHPAGSLGRLVDRTGAPEIEPTTRA